MNARNFIALLLLLILAACGARDPEYGAKPSAVLEITKTIAATHTPHPTGTMVTITVTPTITPNEPALVKNGSFDKNIAQWEIPYGTLRHTESEYHSEPGAAYLTTSDATNKPNYRGTIGQCINLSGQLDHWPDADGQKHLAIEAYLQTDANITSATLNGILSDDSRCGTGHVGRLATPDLSGGQDWIRVLATIYIPDAAKSIHIFVWATGKSDSAAVYIDDIRIYPASSEVTP